MPGSETNASGRFVKAAKHWITTDEIRHAVDHALRLMEFEYNGEERLLVIGDNGHGTLLELLLVPAANPDRVIHADRLRPSLFDYLR